MKRRRPRPSSTLGQSGDASSPTPRLAAALAYEPGVDPAPRVVAHGQGLLAERIIEVARAHGVPVHHDAATARILQSVEIDAHLPHELYLAVAQILVFLYTAHDGRPPVER